MGKNACFLLFGVIVALQFGCEKAENPISVNTSLYLRKVTGLDFRDENGNQLGQVGNPNTRIDSLFVYPNPVANVVHIHGVAPIRTVYMVSGEKDTSFPNTNFASLLAKHQYPNDSLLQARVISWEANGANDLSLDVSAYGQGYYRMFVRTETDSLYWDNIFIYRNMSSGEVLNFLVAEWP